MTGFFYKEEEEAVAFNAWSAEWKKEGKRHGPLLSSSRDTAWEFSCHHVPSSFFPSEKLVMVSLCGYSLNDFTYISKILLKNGEKSSFW